MSNPPKIRSLTTQIGGNKKRWKIIVNHPCNSMKLKAKKRRAAKTIDLIKKGLRPTVSFCSKECATAKTIDLIKKGLRPTLGWQHPRSHRQNHRPDQKEIKI